MGSPLPHSTTEASHGKGEGTLKQFRMVFVAIIALTGLVGSFAIGFSTAATASSTLPGVCLTVSLSEIRSTLGGAQRAEVQESRL